MIFAATGHGVRRRQRARRHAPHHVRRARPDRPAASLDPVVRECLEKDPHGGRALATSCSALSIRRCRFRPCPHPAGGRFPALRPGPGRSAPLPRTGRATISGTSGPGSPGPGSVPARSRRGLILAAGGAALTARRGRGHRAGHPRRSPGVSSTNPPASAGNGSLAAIPAPRRPRAPRRRRDPDVAGAALTRRPVHDPGLVRGHLDRHGDDVRHRGIGRQPDEPHHVHARGRRADHSEINQSCINTLTLTGHGQVLTFSEPQTASVRRGDRDVHAPRRQTWPTAGPTTSSRTSPRSTRPDARPPPGRRSAR